MGALASLSATALAPGRRLADLTAPARRRAQHELSTQARRAVLSAVDVALSTLDDALRSSVAQEIADRVLTSQLAEDVRERVIARALDSPDAEPLVSRLIDSHLVEAAMLDLLENEGLWILVEEIARSPAVTQAISQQGLGFADQMAGVVRQRSLTADERMERFARRLARRPPRTDSSGGDEPASAS